VRNQHNLAGQTLNIFGPKYDSTEFALVSESMSGNFPRELVFPSLFFHFPHFRARDDG
jgi:hypothetical protein